jgi:hypothetical protein
VIYVPFVANSLWVDYGRAWIAGRWVLSVGSEKYQTLRLPPVANRLRVQLFPAIDGAAIVVYSLVNERLQANSQPQRRP